MLCCGCGVFPLTVILGNTVFCALDDGSGVRYVSNTGRIAGVTDRVCLPANPKSVEHGLEAIQLDRMRIESQDRGEVVRTDPQR